MVNVSEISQVERDLPPAHYTLKIESFSLLVNSQKEKYESDGSRRLVLYPEGNKKSNGNCHSSLYLEIDGVESFSDNWQVFVNFKLFVFDQIQNKYLTIQDVDGKVRRSHKMKTEWGFDQLISFEDFHNSSKGYLVNDCCAFGAEVFVIKPTHKGETLSMVKLKPPTDKATLAWKIENFSKLDKAIHYSDKYTVGDRKWKIKIYPKGRDSAEGDYLSVFLVLDDLEKLPPKGSVYAEFKLRVLDQRHNTHFEKAEISQVERDLPPAHYLLKIESFSLLVNSKKEKYESGTFEAGGYKWRLVLYPDGNKKSNGNCHISLYLEIDGVESFSDNLEVFVNFKLFVFDQIQNKYLTIQDVDGKVRRFHKLKTEWGFDQLISFEDFYNSSKGYLVNDCCAFGAEVFVIKPTHKGETLSMVKLKPPTDKATLTCKIESFSKLDKEIHYSNKYAVGNRKWKIKIYPKGRGPAEGDYLSVFLVLDGVEKLALKGSVYAEFKLRVLDQRHDTHFERAVIKHWFPSPGHYWGYDKFFPLGNLREVSKGYVINDTLIVEAEILVVSAVKNHL